MAATASDRRSRVVEALGFWLITLLICAIAGFASYRFGREWIGDRLGSDVKSVMTKDDLADRINDDALTGDAEEDDAEAIPDEPPEEAQVEVETVSLTGEDEAALEDQEDRPASERDDDEPDDDEEASAREDDDEADAPSEPRVPEDDDEADEPSVQIETGGGDGKFIVRAGSFGKRDNADALVQELRAKGYQPFTSTATVDGREYTRVNVATYGERDEALKLRGALRSEGYDADVSTQ